MCSNMKELQTISERVYRLEQEKSKKKKEMDALEKEISQLKSEASSYIAYCAIQRPVLRSKTAVMRS